MSCHSFESPLGVDHAKPGANSANGTNRGNIDDEGEVLDVSLFLVYLSLSTRLEKPAATFHLSFSTGLTN
jgi:hypothetical protein